MAQEQEQKQKKRFMIKIQISLMWILVITVIAIASIIYIPWYLMSKENIAQLVVNLNGEIMKGVNQEIKNIFDKAITTQHIIKETFEKKIIDISNKSQREQYYLNLLKANPSFTWISFGYPNGDFFGVQREPEKEQINIINNIWHPEKNTGTRYQDIYVKNEKDYEYQTQSVYEKNYYSPERPWFQKAIKEYTDIWTDVYVFSTTKKPGINSAIRLDIDDQNIGVISVAFELEDISQYLKTIKVSDNGKVFIIDSQEQLIGSQDLREIDYKDVQEEDPKLKKINQVNNNFLLIINDTLKNNGITIDKIEESEDFNYFDNITNQNYIVTIMPAQQLDWYVVTVIPDSDYLADIQRKSFYLLMIILFIFVVALIISILVSKRIIVRPILRITEQLAHIEKFHLKRVKHIDSRIKEINILSRGIKQMTQGLLSFQKYIPTKVVRDMISEGIQAEVGGQEKELTIFFSDLAYFTKIFEKQGNPLIHQLSEYLDEMSEIIVRENGAIDKYIGDSIMAFWGAPIPNEKHALCACRAALAFKKALAKLHIRWKNEGKPLFTERIGINTGIVVVGNIGSNKRLNYTVLGDPVNLASRLEGLNKIYKTEILIGQNTYKKAAEHIIARKIDSVAVYGKTEPENIYELIANRDEIGITDRFEWINLYEKAHELYQARQWEKAIATFKKAISQKGSKDYPSLLFIYICRKYLKTPPPPNWNGVTVMKAK